jgi:alcohol dehydrogenase class IV
VCVPTTAGTGSEVSTGAVVTDPAAGMKRTILNAALLPRAVVADPETTAALPAALTAATGMDALTHALEALCAPSWHPMCDAIALEALRMIAVHLPHAVREPDERPARANMLMASSMAAVAFQKGLGLCHAMAHPLGAVTGLHHGLANALLLPHVLEINAPAIYEPCARLVDALHLRAADPVATVREWVIELVDQIGLPAHAPITGDAALIARLVPLAQGEKLYLATNPRAVTADEIAHAYRAALGA